jgi:phage minor structural protein
VLPVIPILYDPLETQFDSNGIGLLTDAISCIVEEERNGSFELTLQYPQEGRLAKYITEDAVIKAKPNDKDGNQLFRIYKSGKPIGGVNTYYAEHISYELNMNPVCRPKISGKNAQEAIAQLLEEAVIGNNYTAWSDITTRNSTQIDDVLSVRNILGGTEGSILDVWGGEFQFDNFTVKLHKSRGSDTGATIRYGKNLISAEQERNIGDVITAIFPYCYYTPEKEEGATEEPDPVFVSLPEKFINTPNADKYARLKCVPMDFSDEFEDGVIVSEEMLRKVAKAYTESGIDEPKISIKATFQNLKKTKDYENIQALETIGICDTVTVMIEKLGIEVKAKIIRYSYDSIKERFDSVEIGEPKTNLTKAITAAQKEQKEQIVKSATRAEIIQKRIEQTIKDVTAAITGNSGGHVLLYPAENPQEIYIMDTDSTATAKNVWRWNLAGLGHSSNGIGGPYETAITAAGQIVADFIAVGKLNGALIEAGTINAESLSVEYKQSVKKYTDDGDAKLLSEMKSRFEVTGESITAEVERAQAAEKTISDDLELAKQDAEDFKENVEGAFRDGIITETEAQTIERYIKELEKDNASIQKQYNAVLDSASRQSTTTVGSNFSIKFNADCKTEISSGGTKYDYLYLFYQKDGKIYKALDKVSGADIAGNTYIVPSTDIYIQWYSDGSGNKDYGFSIDEIKQVSTAANTTGTESTLPTYEVIEAATVSMIQTSHPYENNMRKLWHYKKRTATRSTLISKKNAYTNAYNAVITAINNAISDKKITATEKANVNAKFDAYNAALADLKETIEAVGVDVAAVAAAAVAEYARAAIKVEADKIELRVTSKEVESLIEQKADSIRLKASKISWTSTYSSMTENGTLTCQNATIKGTLYSENGKNKVYLRNGRMEITYNSQDIGLIGGNGFTGYSNKEGLNFDLEYTGDYMAWAAQPSKNTDYDVKWTYARSSFANLTGSALNAGCDIDMHNWTLKNPSFEGGGIYGTINFTQILNMNSDGSCRYSNGCHMQFKNGILVSGSWSNG